MYRSISNKQAFIRIQKTFFFFYILRITFLEHTQKDTCKVLCWFCTFLLSRECAVDPPVIAGVAATLQLLPPYQGHAVGRQLRDPVFGSPAQVEPVEAEATRELKNLVGVGLGVPCVAAMLRLPQLLPHITDAARKADFGHLGWKDGCEQAGEV